MAVQDDQALLGECKWRNADINMEYPQTIIRTWKSIRLCETILYVIFKNGIYKKMLKNT